MRKLLLLRSSVIFSQEQLQDSHSARMGLNQMTLLVTLWHVSQVFQMAQKNYLLIFSSFTSNSTCDEKHEAFAYSIKRMKVGKLEERKKIPPKQQKQIGSLCSLQSWD